GEHQVLPQQDAAFVQRVVEGLVLVDHGAADAQHVHAGSAYLGDGLAQGIRRGGQLDDIQRRPAGAATEHVDAIDAQREIPLGAFDLEGAETGAAEIDGDVFSAALHLDRDPVTGRLAMRVRPPELRPRHLHAAPPAASIPLQFRARPLVAALDDKACGTGAIAQFERQLHDAVFAFDPTAQIRLADSQRALLDPYRPPRPGRRTGRRPAWRAPEQAGTEPAQLRVRQHGYAPARPWSLLRQLRGEGGATNQQIMRLAVEFERQFVRHEHVVAVQQVHAVEPDIGQRGQAIETEHDGSGGGVLRVE